MATQDMNRGTLLCPRCWHAFDRDAIVWTSQDQSGQQRPAAPRSQAEEPGIMGKLLGWFGRRAAPPPPPPTPQELEERRTARCPFCDESLPRGFVYSRTLIIGLVGGSASGKTHYLTALLQRLFDMADLRPDGCIGFAPVGDTARRFRADYYNSLFVRHEPFGLTPPLGGDAHNPPLVWEMTIQPNGPGAPVPYTVLFFDASGEQLEDEQDQVRYHKYLFYADALILFADPHSMPRAMEWLDPGRAAGAAPPRDAGPGSRPAASPVFGGAPFGDARAGEPAPAPPRPQDAAETAEGDGPRVARVGGFGRGRRPRNASEPETDAAAPAAAAFSTNGAPAGTARLPHEFFVDMVSRYNDRHGRPGHEKIQIPVALVISKADELKYVHPVAESARRILPPPPLDSAGQQDSRTEAYHWLDLVETSMEVRTILGQIAPPAMTVTLEAFSNLSYHLVSATGCSPNQEGRYPHVTPQRVVDPFAHLMIRLKVLGAMPGSEG